MKLAYLVGTFPSLSETFIAREILALRAAGLKPVLFALRRGELDDVNEELRALAAETIYLPSWYSPRAGWDKLRFLTTRPLALISAGMAYALGGSQDVPHFAREVRHIAAAYPLARELARGRNNKIDHLHIHFASLPASVGWLACRLSGVPYSLSVHAWDVFAQRVHLRAKLMDARKIICCHRAALDFLRRKFPELPRGKTVLIHHGVDIDAYPTASHKRRLPPEPLRIVAVGRLEPKKGFDVLVRAGAILKRRGLPFQLRIIGEGTAQAREALAGLIGAFDLTDEIQLLGRLPHERVIEHLADAALLALPTRIMPDGDRDGIANVLLEAMACGLPVVCSNLPGPAEAVRHEVEGLLTSPDDPLDVANACQRLAREDGLAARLGRAGRKRVEEKFDIEVNVRKLVDVFARL